jgi:histone-lysine N-methyltransferase SETMAR
VASAEKIMVRVVWVEKGVILVMLLPVGTTEGLRFSLKPSRHLKVHLCRFHPTRKTSELLLLEDNVRPHTNVCSTEAITDLGWTVLQHSPYSPDLTPSDYPPFGPLTREKPVRNTT